MELIDILLALLIFVAVIATVWVVVYRYGKLRRERQDKRLQEDKKGMRFPVEEPAQANPIPNGRDGEEGQSGKETLDEPEDDLKTKIKQQHIPREENIVLETVKKRRVEPENRGGRSRGPVQNFEPQRNHQNKSSHLKPEIICWKREWQWIPAVEIPEEILGNSDLTVFQNSTPLMEDQFEEGRWPLVQATGEVIIRWNENGIKESKMTLGEERYLLFKLSGQEQNRGRCVKSPSIGSYLVVASDNWEREESISGIPPIAPESVSFVGYQAHFFILTKDDVGRIAFRLENKIIPIESKAPWFKLEGNLLNDVNDNIGPLFGVSPPNIAVSYDEAWMNVGTVVVGEEGSGRERWRTVLNPVPEQIVQELPSEVAAKRIGWYFLRFYNQNDDLIESLDFRFIKGLKDIRIRQSSFLPLSTGHEEVPIEFIHELDCKVQPADASARRVMIEQKDEKTILAIPPDPSYDNTFWRIGLKNGQQLESHILVERVWWTVGLDSGTPNDWKDTCISLSRDDFVATSNKAIWVRFPRPRWVNTISVGFKREFSRCFVLKVTENTLAIPLREFADTKEVADRTNDCHLKIWIKHNDVLFEGIMSIIIADQLIESKKEAHLTDRQEDGSKTKQSLNLVMISIPRLATSLTKLRKITRGPMRVLIKEVRRSCPRGHTALQAESAEFVKEAFCIIAIYLEKFGEESISIQGFNKLRIDQATFAKHKYPEIMGSLRNRYKILSGGDHRNSNTRYSNRGRQNESD